MGDRSSRQILPFQMTPPHGESLYDCPQLLVCGVHLFLSAQPSLSKAIGLSFWVKGCSSNALIDAPQVTHRDSLV
jgi:hypothetical protein